MSDTPPKPAAPPLPTPMQQRLSQVFDHARRSFDKGDWDYAHKLFAQCVADMPGNVVYLQHFRANLTKCGTAKKSSSMLRSKSTNVAKLAEKGQWAEAFAAGCEALRKNTTDEVTLRELAAACGALGHSDTQLIYLRWALDADPHSRETNRQAAQALTEIHEYEQAIACWRRILQQKPDDQEAAKAVSRLSVEQTIHQGGYETESQPSNGDMPQLKTARVADLSLNHSEEESDASENSELSEEQLLAAIDAAPEDAGPYVALADHYLSAGRGIEAERLLAKAVTLADESLPIREKLEDAQLSRVRGEVLRTQQALNAGGGEKAAANYRRTLQQADQIELDIYSTRAEREPNDPRRQFDLGVRLKRVGRQRDAIKAFQAARGDTQRTAETQLYLGECFQQIKQYKLAATSYDAAVEASAQQVTRSEAAEELRRLALYRAGVLAMGLGELEKAEDRLTELAGQDFGYRDVADRLDKIAAMRNDA